MIPQHYEALLSIYRRRYQTVEVASVSTLHSLSTSLPKRSRRSAPRPCVWPRTWPSHAFTLAL